MLVIGRSGPGSGQPPKSFSWQSKQVFHCLFSFSTVVQRLQATLLHLAVEHACSFVSIVFSSNTLFSCHVSVVDLPSTLSLLELFLFLARRSVLIIKNIRLSHNSKL